MRGGGGPARITDNRNQPLVTVIPPTHERNRNTAGSLDPHKDPEPGMDGGATSKQLEGNQCSGDTTVITTNFNGTMTDVYRRRRNLSPDGFISAFEPSG